MVMTRNFEGGTLAAELEILGGEDRRMEYQGSDSTLSYQ